MFHSEISGSDIWFLNEDKGFFGRTDYFKTPLKFVLAIEQEYGRMAEFPQDFKKVRRHWFGDCRCEEDEVCPLGCFERPCLCMVIVEKKNCRFE